MQFTLKYPQEGIFCSSSRSLIVLCILFVLREEKIHGELNASVLDIISLYLSLVELEGLSEKEDYFIEEFAFDTDGSFIYCWTRTEDNTENKFHIWHAISGKRKRSIRVTPTRANIVCLSINSNLTDCCLVWSCGAGKNKCANPLPSLLCHDPKARSNASCGTRSSQIVQPCSLTVSRCRCWGVSWRYG